MNNLKKFLKIIKLKAKRNLKENNNTSIYKNNVYDEMIMVINDIHNKEEVFYFIGNDIINMILEYTNNDIVTLIKDINKGLQNPLMEGIKISIDTNKNYSNVIQFCIKHMTLNAFIKEPLFNLLHWYSTGDYKKYEQAYYNMKKNIIQLFLKIR